jgi:hypothetical protein
MTCAPLIITDYTNILVESTPSRLGVQYEAFMSHVILEDQAQRGITGNICKMGGTTEGIFSPHRVGL